MPVARLKRRAVVAICLASSAIALCVSTTRPLGACDTPVYRYAMYRWEPAPYQVYYFHEEPIDEKATKIKEMVEAVEQSEKKPGNLMFISVDLKKDTELKTIPPYVKEDWLAQKEPVIPSYMVVAPPPYFVKLFSGDLDEATISALIESPARGEIAKQLEQGKASVLVMLTGNDEKANGEAEKTTKALIKDIASGEVQLYLPPTAFMQDDESKEKTPGLEFGYVKVKRDDPKEHWLVEFLLSMENDLKDAEWVDKPMIFAVFGRGRALPPFVGKGISRDNLLDCVDFVTGACSCTVKDQNPGVDLLFAYDWYTAAENLATNFGAEEGNEYGFGAEDFFPDLIIPTKEEPNEGDAADAMTEDNEKQGDEGKDVAEEEKDEVEKTTDEVEKTTDEVEKTTDEGETKQAKPPAEKAPDAAGEDDASEEEPKDVTEKPKEDEHTVSTTAMADREVASAETAGQPETMPTVDTDSTPETTALTGVFAVGTGVGVALILLFALTFVVLRPR